MNNESALIVVAEDNRGDTFLIREALQQQGLSFSLKEVDDGESMLALINSLNSNDAIRCPDLILLDLHLPKRSGEEVLTHLRNVHRCRNTPVIIMTSSDSPWDRQMAAALQATAYFRKPSDLEGFLEIGALVRETLTANSPVIEAKREM